MTINYEKIGLKCGLEVHQQLDTNKLFCSCPSVLRKDEPDFEVTRKLHSIAGESGKVDVAVKHEAQREREFVYQGYDSTCLVELDEEPPHEINEEALMIVIHIALLLNCKILPISQIMRKTVIDGSNTSGFQRTVLVAQDGYVDTEDGRVRIESICLEEDSARIIERDEKKAIYRIDRLGIPLIEVTTAPDIKNAKQAKETALQLGSILRSCKVRRGLGTIRQDVNVSIKDGNRVEIKGFQNPDIMIDTIDNEILRQKGLMDLTKIVPVFEIPKICELKNIIKPELAWMQKAIQEGSAFVGCRLKDFKGLLGQEFFSGFRLGTDIARYAKTRGFGGVIHSDEKLEDKYKFSDSEIEEIKKELELEENDAFLMVLGNKNDAEKMFKEVLFPRIEKLKEVNPKEVRNSLPDGSTEFLRPMPGSARMYPETDLPLLKISRDFINEAKKTLPKLRGEIEKDLRNQGLNEEMIRLLFKQNKLEDFKELLYLFASPLLAARILLIYPKELAKRKNMSIEEINNFLTKDVFIVALEALKNKTISEDDIKHFFERVIEGEDVNKAIIFEKENLEDVEEKIMKIINEKKGLSSNAYMGLVMKEFKGKITGQEAMRVIQKFI